jgi:hypothetical protein
MTGRSRSNAAFVLPLALALGAGFAFAPAARAARGERVPGSRYVSARGAAMGDAFAPLVDDGAAALFYNPAAIGRLRGLAVEPMNLSLGGNSGYLGNASLDFYKVFSLDSYESVLAANPGRAASVSAAFLPAVSMRGLAAGVLAQRRYWAVVENGAVRYRSKLQFIPAVGGALRLGSGVVRIGYSLQWVQEASGDITVPTGTRPLGHNQQLAEGSAFSQTIGFAVTLPYTYLPSFNLVARNVLGASFRSFTLLPQARNSIGVPADEPASYDASVSISPRLGPRGGLLNFVANYRDLTNTSAMPWFGRASVGVEWAYRERFFLRGGWASGYPSAGIGLRRPRADLSISWFSEEMGTGYRQLRDTRFLMQYQVRAF